MVQKDVKRINGLVQLQLPAYEDCCFISDTAAIPESTDTITTISPPPRKLLQSLPSCSGRGLAGLTVPLSPGPAAAAKCSFYLHFCRLFTSKD